VDYGSGFDDELDQFLKAGFVPARIIGADGDGHARRVELPHQSVLFPE
jgi:hypothetical protein